MKLDKEPAKTDVEENKLPSEKIENAHASGDGAIERSEEEDIAKANRDTSKNDLPY